MTRDDTLKVLAILKAAYPNFYKDLSKQEASAVIGLWSVQLAEVPVDIVCFAINKIIATNTFPPTIAEVKKKLSGMYAEAVEELLDGCKDQKKIEYLHRIENCCREIEVEPSLGKLMTLANRGKSIETHDMQQGALPTL